MNTIETERFDDLLPLYIRGSLSDEDVAWVDAQLAHSEQARFALGAERLIHSTIKAEDARLAESVSADEAYSRFLASIAPKPRTLLQKIGDQVEALLASISSPRWAAAMMMVVVAQAGVITFGLSREEHRLDLVPKSIPSATVDTLRVKFKEDVEQRQIQKTLSDIAVIVVYGPFPPTGEWWLASERLSLDEMEAELKKSGVTESIAKDLKGPPRRH
jgi:hypothetical protein